MTTQQHTFHRREQEKSL